MHAQTNKNRAKKLKKIKKVSTYVAIGWPLIIHVIVKSVRIRSSVLILLFYLKVS